MPTTNGTSSPNNSKFLSHLTTYPVVSDGVETFKSNPYGKKSLDLADSAYQRFAKPVEPYLETPYSYAKPYVAKADELADEGLGKVESRFPIVKEETGAIVEKGRSVAGWPLQLAGEGRDYVVNTWNDEYNKTASHKSRSPATLPTLLLAMISFQLRLASDFFQLVADFLGPKYEEGKSKASDYAQQAQETADEYTKFGKEKANDLQKKGDEYTKQAQDKAGEVKKEGEKQADGMKKEGEKKVDGAKQEAGQKKEEVKGKAQK
ncbi:uncharacterized protein LTR77_006299 [Saxophila tyrrhenica]|uniref:Uncharacterized protein n=1 Tax=Saxophila tyrrhenica TaxID=1690608 RepID=A0AAV9P854_9PEZI|nr:hypothetical protein LTR77_006299 [Saxophila tyrrhenica]